MFDDGTRVSVRGDRLAVEPDRSTAITTVRDAAAFVGVELTSHPPVGHDLPPFEPDRHLDVDAAASCSLGAWWALGDSVLATVRGELADAMSASPSCGPSTSTWRSPSSCPAVSASTSASRPEMPATMRPTCTSGHTMPRHFDRDDPYWNAPFGALLPRHEVGEGSDALAFIQSGFARLT